MKVKLSRFESGIIQALKQIDCNYSSLGLRGLISHSSKSEMYVSELTISFLSKVENVGIMEIAVCK